MIFLSKRFRSLIFITTTFHHPHFFFTAVDLEENRIAFLLLCVLMCVVIIQRDRLFLEIIQYNISIPRLIHFIWIGKYLNDSVSIPDYVFRTLSTRTATFAYLKNV